MCAGELRFPVKRAASGLVPTRRPLFSVLRVLHKKPPSGLAGLQTPLERILVDNLHRSISPSQDVSFSRDVRLAI